ncbi:MAG: tetratricopeptide repeat protein [Thermoguttaceae bacterium]
MRRRSIPWLACLPVLLAAATASALDQVKTPEKTVMGTVKSASALKVDVEQRDGKTVEIPAGQIESITFEEEPAVLKTARAAVSAGRYEDALAALAEVDTSKIARREIVQDIEYIKVYSAARMALVGNGDIADAGSKVFAFVGANNDSYHYLDAQMLFGDLAGAAGKPQAAQAAYKTVGQMAPWPDYRARAAVALGRSYLASGQIPEASTSFKIVLSMPDSTPGIQAHKLAATLGEARCMAGTNNLNPAIESIQNVIKQADSENSELLAEAYNALGASYRASKRPKDALLAFLHVHLVYFNSPQNHIEALQNLVELWNEQQMPERSAEAVQVLRDRYKRSPR